MISGGGRWRRCREEISFEATTTVVVVAVMGDGDKDRLVVSDEGARHAYKRQ
jgi:hypothetical protein